MQHDYDIHRVCKRCGFNRQGLRRELHEEEKICAVDEIESARKFNTAYKAYLEFLEKEMNEFNGKVKR